MFVSRRTSSFDQQIRDAGQMRTPPPLTPRDIESRVLRICNEYDKIQETQKNKVNFERVVRRTVNLSFALIDHLGNPFYE